MSKSKRIGKWVFWPLFAIVISGLTFYFWSENPLLGRWVQAHSENGTPGGFQFFRTRKFVTFGLQQNEIPITASGTYRFTTNNQVELVFKQLHLRVGGVETNVAVKSMEPLFNTKLRFVLSGDGLSLEEIDETGWEGRSMVLRKE